MTDTPRRDSRVEILATTTPFQGHYRIDRYRLRHRRFDGGWTGEMSRECFERGHAAAVLPYDPARDVVVLVEQFRIGAYAAGLDPWIVEVIAGVIEPGEDPAEVARREALEEAGCTITALEPIGKVLPSPGGCSEILYMYCGRVEAAGVGGVHGLAHEHEDIRAFALPCDEALTRLARGEILAGNALMTLQWLALNRERLRRQWA
ncbi:MAG: NUDIX domain-containing protein [Kiloniellaceae bacterium]